MLRLGLVAILFLTACESMPIRMADRPNSDIPVSSETTTNDQEVSEQGQQQASKRNIGVIIGPGAMNTVAAGGVLKYLHSQEIDIKYIVGLGFGSVVGALYANNQKPHEVDWQLFKLKETNFREKSLFGSYKDELDVDKLSKSLQKVFGQKKLENFRVPFACSDPGLSQGVYRLQLSGRVTSAISNCVNKMQVSAEEDSVYSFNQMMEFLREKDIGFVIYIDSLSQLPINDLKSLSPQQKIIWNRVGAVNQQFSELADFTFKVSSQDLSLYSFANAKAMIGLGQKRAREQFGSLKNTLKR